MTKNPFVNAILAVLYIVVVASIMNYGRLVESKVTILIPIVVLSLFVLSACVMGYSFFYQPILMYLDGQKQQALSLFFKTLGTFAGITALILIVAFFVV